MKKCKDCGVFKNGCRFLDIGKELGLDGNFVACVQFIPSKVIRDCLSCSNSCSEPCDNGDILHCMEQDGKVVEESGYCDNWN